MTEWNKKVTDYEEEDEINTWWHYGEWQQDKESNEKFDKKNKAKHL